MTSLATISITEDQVPVRGKLKSGILTDRTSLVDRPDNLLMVIGDRSATVNTDNGNAKEELVAWRGVVTQEPYSKD